MRLIHYSGKPLTAVHSVEQSGERYEWHGGRKPHGLWVSVEGDDDWRAWCEAANFRDVASQLAHEIVLVADHNVLVLDTSTSMTIFQKEYGVDKDCYGAERRIDWPRVANRHRGIVIAPYQWNHRLDGPCSAWYYSWDCASGCIWDARAVASVHLARAKIAA